MSWDAASRLVVFRLCGQGFALAVESVAEVVPFAWLDRPPGLPAVMEGILNLGGRAVAVLRTDRILGLGDGRFGLDASILVLRGEGEGALLGLLVEHVDGVPSGEEARAMGLDPRRSFNGCVVDQLELGGRTLHLLDAARLLLEEETARLAEFRATAEARLGRLADGTA